MVNILKTTLYQLKVIYLGKQSQTFNLLYTMYLSTIILNLYIFFYFIFRILRKFSYGNIKNSADKVAEGLLEYVFDQSMALLYLAEASIDWQQSSATTSPIRILRITPHSSARNSFICRNGFTKSRSWCTWKTIFCI